MLRHLIALVLIAGTIGFLTYLNREGGRAANSPLDKFADRLAILVSGVPQKPNPPPLRRPTPRRAPLPNGGPRLAQPPQGPVPSRLVQVERGDTLFKLARRHLGNGHRYREIAALNQLREAARLEIGQEVRIPLRPGAASPEFPPIADDRPSAAPPVAPKSEIRNPKSSETYTIRKGDSLADIARRRLGSAARWRELAEINKLRSPSELKVGQVIKLPGKPVSVAGVRGQG